MSESKSKSLSERTTIGYSLSCLILFRIAYLLVLPFDLVHDEAYYWDWSRSLDWCYYSKPPGIAWLIAISTRLFGSTPFFVRLPAALLSVLTVWFAYALGSRIYGTRAGFATAAMVAFSPGNMATGIVMTIDAPFLCCWSASLYCLWRMLERGLHRWKWSTLTLLSVGFGLLFKQTMLAFPVLAGSFVLLHQSDRKEWLTPSFWFAGLGALAFLAPMVWWNSQHDWITFVHTSEHFEKETLSFVSRLLLCAEFLVSQAGLISPWTYLCMTGIALLCWKHWRTLTRREHFLLWFWIGPILATTMLSLMQRVEANWPAPFYATAFVLFAGIACRQTAIRVSERLLPRAVATAALIAALVYSLPFAIQATDTKGCPVDLVVRMWGWSELAAKVDARLEEQHASLKPNSNVLVTLDRAVASELAFYLPQQPQVTLWSSDDAVNSQYDVWAMTESGKTKRRRNKESSKTLLVSRDKLPRAVRDLFSSIRDLGKVTVPINPKRAHEVHLWIGTGEKHNPTEKSEREIARREERKRR